MWEILPAKIKTNVCFVWRSDRIGSELARMRNPTFSTLLRGALFFAAVCAVQGCSAAAEPPPPLIDPTPESPPSDEEAGEVTGDVDVGDPPGEDDATYPIAGSVDIATDAVDDSPEADEPEATPTPAAGPPGKPGASPKKPAPNWVGVALAHPNKNFKRQVRHPKWNPTGPLFSGNCAPTSLAMVAKVFGKEPKGLTIEQSIDRVRVMMNKPSDSGGATEAQVRLGAKKLGLHFKAIAKGSLDAELAKKHMVVLTGAPGIEGTAAPSAYQKAFRAAGYFYTFDGHHSIAVFGKTASGKYVVADPLSKVGVITLTEGQMSDYWKRWGGSGTAVWR
jgi:hypothetical protein